MDVKLFVKVLTCLQQLMQQNTYRKTAYGSLVVRLLTQVVLLHQLLKCHRTAKDFHGHSKKLTLNYRQLWLTFTVTSAMLLRDTDLKVTT